MTPYWDYPAPRNQVVLRGTWVRIPPGLITSAGFLCVRIGHGYLHSGSTALDASTCQVPRSSCKAKLIFYVLVFDII